jgi:hypothetical protein
VLSGKTSLSQRKFRIANNLSRTQVLAQVAGGLVMTSLRRHASADEGGRGKLGKHHTMSILREWRCGSTY